MIQVFWNRSKQIVPSYHSDGAWIVIVLPVKMLTEQDVLYWWFHGETKKDIRYVYDGEKMKQICYVFSSKGIMW